MKHHDFFSSYPVIRAVTIAVLLFVLAMVASVAHAQTAWDTNTLAWDAPTACTSGQPIANCAVTSYRIERSATATGAFAALGTSTTTTYTHQSAAAGQNCYRVIAISATGESVPSNVACKTNTQPDGPPNAPTNLRTISTTVYNVKPNLQKWAFERGAKVPGAIVKAQSACDEDRCVTDSREGNFCVVSRLTQITPRPAEGSVLMALCG